LALKHLYEVDVVCPYKHFAINSWKFPVFGFLYFATLVSYFYILHYQIIACALPDNASKTGARTQADDTLPQLWVLPETIE